MIDQSFHIKINLVITPRTYAAHNLTPDDGNGRYDKIKEYQVTLFLVSMTVSLLGNKRTATQATDRTITKRLGLSLFPRALGLDMDESLLFLKFPGIGC